MPWQGREGIAARTCCRSACLEHAAAALEFVSECNGRECPLALKEGDIGFRLDMPYDNSGIVILQTKWLSAGYHQNSPVGALASFLVEKGVRFVISRQRAEKIRHEREAADRIKQP